MVNYPDISSLSSGVKGIILHLSLSTIMSRIVETLLPPEMGGVSSSVCYYYCCCDILCSRLCESGDLRGRGTGLATFIPVSPRLRL